MTSNTTAPTTTTDTTPRTHTHMHTHTQMDFVQSSIMHLHIPPLKITAFDLKHLLFALMQQNIIQSHSFDPAVDYVTNFL